MNKIKYIGIRGHRGSGKNTIAYLLGSLIQYFIDNKDCTPASLIEDGNFCMFYRVCCEAIKHDEQEALANADSNNVYIETFGSTPKMLVELLTDIPHEYFNSDYHKDHVLVNLSDFSWRVEEDPTNKVTFNHEGLLSEIMRGNIEEIDQENITLSLRELIVYFAVVSMMFLGNSIWVKAMRCNERRNAQYDDYYNIGTIYKIFSDIKAPSELSYVKELGGIVVKVERPEYAKADKGVSTLDADTRFDYEVVIEKDIEEDEKLKKQLLEIAYTLTRE